MKLTLGFLLMALCLPSLAQTPEVRVPADLHEGDVDQAMVVLAREAMSVYREEDPTRYLGTRFRLQLVAGQYAQAIDSIHAFRALRNDLGPQPPIYLQYEIHARAKVLQARGVPFAQAWRQAFAQQFGALDDRTALQAEFGFGTSLARLRGDLDAALAKTAGRRSLPLLEAIDLVRAYQVHAAYAEFQPLFDAALEEDDARRYRIDRDLLVRTPDGARIAALVVRPAKAAPLPTLLQFTIYANDDVAWSDAKTMAANGYAGAVAYSRGKGRSPDTIAPFRHDGADAAAVIDWIARQPWSDGRVGMFGGSYNSFAQWAALKHMPPALRAIATSASAAPGIDIPMEGGVFLNFMYAWPLYTMGNRWLDDARYGDTARWAALDRAGYASGRAYRERPLMDGSANPLFNEWLQHPAYDAYWQAMIPQEDEFAGIDIPVLATTGYFDGAQAGVLHYFREHLRHRPEADHTLLIGPYEHTTMQTGVPPSVQGYTPDAAARIDLQALRLSWFDHVFKGAPKPELLADRVNWQVMGANAWRHARTLETMATRMQKLCLAPGATPDASVLSLQEQPGAVTTQRVDFRDRSDASWTPSPTVVNPQLDPHAGLVFVGDPLPRDTELAGPFEGMLDFTVNKRDVDVVIGVYERTADGHYLDLAWWLQRASYGMDRRQRRLLQAGVPQRLAVKDTRLIGRKLASGSRLVVTLGVSKQPDRQLNLGSGKDPSDEEAADAGQPLEIHWRGSSCLVFGIRD
ncbi:CocE/NonD family hydrolase [Pseudoxanthomonas sp. PXM03]|uniref:CocE/NonD family hydrolase n=1 Tax=Pseudoxanthomonas sp. PXM03 TaxID=2769284 RepID=UPI00177FD4BD|nr:CocE/NonD family hydrolase [Pseudoxanthomonas sp. PXM03]MBD9437278.1 CocE/NonD family hydrolase [Pseudoxanthomonas sp. PXM03]